MERYYKFNFNAPDIPTDELDKIYEGYRKSIEDDTAYQGVLSLGVNLMHDNGYRRFAGYCYNLRPFLKCYIIRQDGIYSRVWAKNKTSIRKIYGRSLKIGVCPKELI